MKRWIHLQYILAMSMTKDRIVDKMRSRSKLIAEHLSKCAMYCNCLPGSSYDHWIEDELATWINDINSLTCKGSNNKLKAKIYEDALFGDLGTSREDAMVNLHDLQIRNKKKGKDYPYAEVDDDMIDRMHQISRKIIKKFVPIMSINNSFSKEDISSLLHNVIDPVCKNVEVVFGKLK